MELTHALRTTAAVREFTADPVHADQLDRILELARFAPSGGNRQPWVVIVLEDPATRRAIRELSQETWRAYIAQLRAGLVPFAVGADGPAPVPPEVDVSAPAPSAFIDGLDQVPALLMVCADLTKTAVMDAGARPLSIVGGASVYPFVDRVLLAARTEGLGGLITTAVCRQRDEVQSLLALPDHVVPAALVALGRPVKELTRLTRAPVEDFTFRDRWGQRR